MLCKFLACSFDHLLIVDVDSWVVIPVWLMIDSYGHIASSLRLAQADMKKTKKN